MTILISSSLKEPTYGLYCKYNILSVSKLVSRRVRMNCYDQWISNTWAQALGNDNLSPPDFRIFSYCQFPSQVMNHTVAQSSQLCTCMDRLAIPKLSRINPGVMW